MARQSFRYDPKLGKLVEIDRASDAYQHFVRGDMEAFVSPLDGALVDGRKQYENHMKAHHVVPYEPRTFSAPKADPIPRRELLWELVDRAAHTKHRR